VQKYFSLIVEKRPTQKSFPCRGVSISPSMHSQDFCCLVIRRPCVRREVCACMPFGLGEFMQVLHRLYGGQSVVLAMALASVLAMAGCSGSGSSASSENVTASPTMSPGAGTYNRSQTVTIADSTPGAVFYCTTDGTTPTVSSPQCSQPSTVFKTEFLQVIAVAP